MDKAILPSLVRQNSLWHEIGIVANNIANASTHGYRAQKAIFSEYIKTSDQSIAGGNFNIERTNFNQGAMTATGSALDVAISGEGFFAVSANGDYRLTRAGNFTISSDGFLVTPSGLRVLDQALGPINVDGAQGRLSIGPDGTISDQSFIFGRVGLFTTQNLQKLQRSGDTLFKSEEGLTPINTHSNIKQGFSEGSNVNVVQEISRMIEIQRSYELGQKFLENEFERQRKTISAMDRNL